MFSLTRTIKMAACGFCFWVLFAGVATAGASSAEAIGKAYATYYAQGNIDGILSLYDLDGVDQQTIEDIRQVNSGTFGSNILSIRYEPAQNAKAYSYVSGDKTAIMWPTLIPVQQMKVAIQETNPPRGVLGVPMMYTIIGQKADGFYLVAFKRTGQ